MISKLKKVTLVLIACLACFVVFDCAEAKNITLDATTIKKGYTLEIENAALAIEPNFLENAGRVKLEKYLNELPAPKNVKSISDIYVYNITQPTPRIFDEPLTVRLNFNSQSYDNKQIHVWHREKQIWQPIPTAVNEEAGYARAYIHFPFSIIGVFEGLGGNIKKTQNYTHKNFGAPAMIAIDAKSGTLLYQKNASQQRSMASLTKLMTAYIFLQNNPGWDKEIIIQPGDNIGGASVDLRPGDCVRVRDLFLTMLVGSKNNATKALVRSTGLSEQIFVDKMNRQAIEWGLTQTWFVEPTGLSAQNKTSARDYAQLAQKVLQRSEIMQGSTMANYTFSTRNTYRTLSVKTTNRLVNSNLYLTGGKTGFTYEAGYCLMSRFRQNKLSQNDVITVVMGDDSYGDIFSETQNLGNWLFESYTWQ